MSTISIKYGNIPKWLKAGDLYRSLSPANFEDIITIPAGCFMETSDCWTDEDDNLDKFSQLIRIVIHWMLDEMPVGVLDFCVKHDADIWQDTILSVPGAEESKVLAPLLETGSINQVLFRMTIKTEKLELILRAAGKFHNKIAATAIAAQEGNLSVLKLLHEQGFAWNEQMCWLASQNNHLDCLQYAHENGCPWDRHVYESAAGRGHLRILQYAYQQGLTEWHVNVCTLAAQNGHLACLQFAHEQGCPWNYEVFKYSASKGHLDCMQYAHHQGLKEWHVDVCTLAAHQGHSTCLQFAHTNGCPWDVQTTQQAALAGKLLTLRYAMEQGCPFDNFLVENAVLSGSIECLRYLIEDQGMRMNYASFEKSLLKGNLSCLQYLVDQGCSFLSTTYASVTLQDEVSDLIFRKDNPEFTQCVRYVVERGWKPNPAFCKYISSRDPECTAYLTSEGLFMDTIIIQYCDIPKWLQAGDFYRNLSSHDPQDVISIPVECYTPYNDWSDDDKNEHDFYQLIRVTMFWILDEIPFGVLEVCSRNPAKDWRDAILNVPGAEKSGIFTPLFGVYPMLVEKFATIVRTGKSELILHAAQNMDGIYKATAIAAEEGNLPVLKLLHEHSFAWDKKTCFMASKNGHLNCLQYAHENGCSWDHQVYVGAARGGHLHIMQYAYQQGLREWHNDACERAAVAGQLACLQFAHEHGCPWNNSIVWCAVKNGHVACLQYLLEQGCPISSRTCEWACLDNQLLCLQLLHEYNTPWDEFSCYLAAEYSDMSCLQFLHEHGCPWDESTLYRAVRCGHLTVLRYAMEHGCPYDGDFMQFVAQNGTMECLRYLVEEQGLYMSTNMFIYALLRGELARVQYLIDQACPFLDTFLPDTTSEERRVYDEIFIKDNPEFTQCVQYAVERGWTASRPFCEYISSRDAECTAYLRSEGLF